MVTSHFSTANLSSRGGRPDNEDSLLCSHAGDLACWVLADGLGGHGGGEIASAVACAAVITNFQASPALTPEALTAYLQAAGRAVRKEQRHRSLPSMRTTLVVLVANPTHALWGYLGDSRLYHFRAGSIVSQTKDHSMPQKLVEAGEITAEEIRHHEDRNRLLRVVGEEGATQPTVSAELTSLQEGDAFLLCSDGFWENVNELEMELDLAKSSNPADWLSTMETRLQERVTGSHDNYTAIAIFGNNLAAPPPPPVQSSRTLEWSVLALLALILLLAALLFLPLVPRKATARNTTSVGELAAAQPGAEVQS